jgi:hypothetical protein
VPPEERSQHQIDAPSGRRISRYFYRSDASDLLFWNCRDCVCVAVKAANGRRKMCENSKTKQIRANCPAYKLEQPERPPAATACGMPPDPRGPGNCQGGRHGTGRLCDVVAAPIVFLGVTAMVSMPTDIFPDINIPVVTVIWPYTGVSTPEMEERVATDGE